ncbi:BrnT family toxin [Ottowia sp.]|uniref:BrnT family toxin n=1 Tax=Ottowia sp. TaxID=1898956 RepID=UPI002CF3EE9B|nr:BrnT family toxin [Ottowia sp.]HOB65261.1 BrnT family toxin [Ottowia sp.]HPZ56177.1 BrnT family toxin [Ottowia sp.]HQD48248.1 BrnT family toxin [Ottowia sp.]
MRITCDPDKRQLTLSERGLDLIRAKEVFAGPHFTRADDRLDYGEPRFITAGWLDARLVVFVWTPRGSARRIISMRYCHEREAKKLRPHLEPDGRSARDHGCLD